MEMEGFPRTHMEMEGFPRTHMEMEGVVGCAPLFRAGYLLGSEPPPSRQPAAADDRVATGRRLMGEVATDESDFSRCCW